MGFLGFELELRDRICAGYYVDCHGSFGGFLALNESKLLRRTFKPERNSWALEKLAEGMALLQESRTSNSIQNFRKKVTF